MFKYSMIVVTICYLVLSFAHPDYWIAKCNVANMGSSQSTFFDADAYEDYGYMTRLSADAAPALADLFAEEGFTMEHAAKGVRGEGNDYPFDSYYDLYGGWRSDEESWGYYYLRNICEAYYDMGIRDFNLSKYVAYQILQ